MQNGFPEFQHLMQLSTRYSFVKTEQFPGKLDVLWGDGHHSIFHYIWLRDNCACAACGDRSGGHRYLELGNIDDNIQPRQVSVSENGALTIEWDNDGHVTIYSPEWLRSHCYSVSAVAERQKQPILWDGSIRQSIPEFDFASVVASEPDRLDLFEHIARYGFAILNAVPVEHEQIEQLAKVFGFIRKTHYGRVFDLISTPEQRILAQTSHAIRPHNDELFRDPIPGLFMMHCLQASECGGGASVFVDGFHAAQKLQEMDQVLFEVLTEAQLPHHRLLVDAVDDVALTARWPAIELDQYGNFKAVHVNERTMAPLDVEQGRTELVYRALKTFLSLLYQPQASINYRLEAGQAAVLDNHRVLHARQAFNGNRHIRQCHVDRDEFFSRLGALQRRLVN